MNQKWHLPNLKKYFSCSNLENKAKARGKNKEWNISGKEITIGVIILMIIGFFILDNGKSDSILAYNVATEYVKVNLRSPSTAEFPGTFEKKRPYN